MITAICQTSDQFYAGNGQEIREAIIRAAVKHCINYATDVVYLLTGSGLKHLTECQNGWLNIYYRAYGVGWRGKPDNVVFHLRLTKDGQKYTLEEVEL